MKNKWFKYIYLEKYRWLIAIIFTCVIAAAILGYYTPMIIAKLYNSYGSKEMFQDAFFTLAIFFITEYINRVIYQLCVNKYVQKLLLEVRGFSYKNWLLNYEVIKTGQNEKDRYPLGEVMARIISDTESVRELVTTGSFAIVIDVVFFAFCLFSFI